ncbi:hypothetical protein AX16_004059 [Volvariella volvacea WC 439]|nr:hypothetical protein AX16_004059 [Volvariella volvacea WC 439]
MPAIAEAINHYVQLQARQDDSYNGALDESPYGYTPTRWICILFLVLFGLSTLLHTGQAIRYRTWFMFLTVILGGAGEILGWAGRLWSNLNIDHEMPFMIQISTTIISPTFILGANFIIFGRIVDMLGSSYSRLRPRLYAIIFLTCDIVSLVVQGAGGGIASAADDYDGAMVGSHIMLGGIVFQLFIITVYMFLSAEFYIRYYYNKPFMGRAGQDTIVRGICDTRTMLMIGGLMFNTLVLFIRAIYRTIELEDGWDGRIITTELYFNVLDGAMIVLAIWTFNFFHPGFLLNGTSSSKPAKSQPSSTSQLNY